MHIFSQVFVAPVVNALLVFYKFFEYLHIPGGLGWSIVAITAAMRLAIHPLMQRQILQAKKMQEIQPHITKLQKKHKSNPQRLQQAQLELFKKHNVNPAFGCVVLIIQLPVFYGLYTALRTIVIGGGMNHTFEAINSLVYVSWLRVSSLDTSFLGLRLNVAPSEWAKVGWWYLAIPLVTGALQYYQSYLSTRLTPPPQKTESGDDDKKSSGGEMQAAMQKQMLYLFPAMIAFASYNFPVGLALYWNIFTLFGISQYRDIMKA